MNLEVGKKYKTRNGQVACVASVKGYGPQSAIGFIEANDSQCLPCQWFPTGEYFTDKMPCANDIVAEWDDTPDPGEGWRLLHPDEDLEPGDEWWSQSEQTWIPSLQSQTIQNHGWCYRRRIAPQYVPYTWEDRDELRGRWYRQGSLEVAIKSFQNLGSGEFRINNYSPEKFLELCEWLDGTPCGKKVVQ